MGDDIVGHESRKRLSLAMRHALQLRDTVNAAPALLFWNIQSAQRTRMQLLVNSRALKEGGIFVIGLVALPPSLTLAFSVIKQVQWLSNQLVPLCTFTHA